MLAARDQAPDFELPALGDGAPVAIRSAGEPVLAVFFRISCPVCQFALPFVERLSKGTLPVVAISQDDAEGTAEFHSELGITLPTLLERRGYPASNAYRITNVPSMFLIGPGGRIEQSVTGFSKEAFEAWAELAGVAPLFLPGERIPAFRPG